MNVKHSIVLLVVMSFLSKQAFKQPRVLCASHCPPHNILHDITEFPLYYDPIYDPTSHRHLFNSVERVCDWILRGLQKHLVECVVCPPLPFKLKKLKDSICYKYPLFDVTLCGLCLQVPFYYVESSSFSFCNLHRLDRKSVV